MPEWDVIVIGGAAAGENAAQYATQSSGLSAVIVEDALVGGECSYWACMPSKTLLRPVQVLAEARDLPGVRELVADGAPDVAAVLARRDAMVHDLDDSSQVEWARGAGIDVIRGWARLTGPRRVEVRDHDGSVSSITARHAVVLDTGSSARIPDTPGFAAALPWTSRDVTALREVPGRVIIVGAGVVACEAATWLRGLGSDVTVVGRGSRVLASLEPFASELVADGLRAAGVDLLLGESLVEVSRVRPVDTGYGRVHGGEVAITLDSGRTLTADELVAATGRAPNRSGLGLETVGLADGEGYLDVDDHLTVSGVDGAWLYAIGDVTGRAQLTHMGKYQARVAGAVIAARAQGRPLDPGAWSEHADLADAHRVPQVVFTEPEVGSVGRTEAQARAAGLRVETAEYDLAALGGTAVLREHYAGRAKLVVDAARDVLVGATFAGPGVAELTHAATIAVVGRVPIPALWHAVPSYPTVSEIWLRLLETLRATRRAAS